MKSVTIADGAMGTELFKRGLENGAQPERLNLTNSQVISEIHNSYIEAGSNLIITNTFGANAERVKLHKEEQDVFALNYAGAAIARSVADAADTEVLVAGSIGPLGTLLEPLGPLKVAHAELAFGHQAYALESGGAHIIWLETFSCLTEARAALDAITRNTNLPIILNMSYDTAGKTMMGVDAEQHGQLANEYDLLGVGVNCGANFEDSFSAAKKLKEVCPEKFIVFKPNAGIPVWRDGGFEYEDGELPLRSTFISWAKQIVETGPERTIVGGCCGTTPEDIYQLTIDLCADSLVVSD